MRKLAGPLLLALAGTLMMAGCSSTKEGPDAYVVEDRSPEALYGDARQAMEAGNFTKATKVLEALDSRYPFGAYKTQVQLDLIYAYYKLADTPSALANIDRFIRLNPTHKDIDYVYYMRGLVNMQADSYLFHELLDMDRTDRDPENAREAFNDFEKLVKTFPDSRYAADGRQRMIAIKNRLAEYSLGVAEYYVKIEAWIAAANRSQQILETYAGTPAVEGALEIMVRSYEELGQETLKQNALTVLKATYPNNDLAR
ncbi:outer membrane protein assembly factor BamD [Ferrimonas sediminicola]|uniref:Outer membrane protein assembly factor BamD n=1 Tax=Ferrimonas sediminicola TaxID=2569538 RepID=A0A4U1BCR9_9GAMM|nr:outer membrane protein assembly factor BamD [Ferrimonas sediminicola]TKB48787.1 outer membrane protein assembly factor BamD [Ferrimonas sediminicola]